MNPTPTGSSSAAAADSRMVSYAQNGEDVVLERIFRHRKDGFFVDVGACHPVHDSVTHHFYLRGWRGINVEPQQAMFAELELARPRDINLAVCVGSHRSVATLHVTEDRGTSTLDESLAKKYRALGRIRGEVEVEVITLSDIWQRHVAGRPVEFLKIDVEGLELQVLQGADFGLVKPLVIIVESVHPESCSPSHEAWEPLLLPHYQPFLFDGINRFYHHRDFPLDHLVHGRPANVLDRFIPYSEFLVEQACRHLTACVEAREAELRNLHALLEQKDAALADAARAYAALDAHYRREQAVDPESSNSAASEEPGASEPTDR